MAKIQPELLRIAARQVRLWRSPVVESRPNLFLVHGGMGDAAWHWHTVWETLGDSFNVAAPDLPQFGSTVELPGASFAALVEWLARVQELAGMSPAVFVGNSFGAGLARLYASAYPGRVTRLILVDGGQLPRIPRLLRYLAGARLLAPWFEVLAQQTLSARGIRRAVGDPALVTLTMISESESATRGFVALMRRVLLSEVPSRRTPQVPTLLVWGERDKPAPVQRAYELSSEIPVTELALIKNAGHLPQLQDPLSFVKIVQEFALPSVNETVQVQSNNE